MVLVAALIVVLVLLMILLFYYLSGLERIKELSQLLEKKQSNSFKMGQNQLKGNIAQDIGTFSVLTEYDEIATLSSTSAQASLDLIGIKDDRIDFIEFKTKGSKLSTKENKLKKLISGGAVKLGYRIMDIEIPQYLEVSERSIAQTETVANSIDLANASTDEKERTN